MTKHRELTEAEKAFARDIERIGADFRRAFADIGKAFEATTTGLGKSQPSRDRSFVRATEPQPGWFDRQLLKVKKVAATWRKR